MNTTKQMTTHAHQRIPLWRPFITLTYGLSGRTIVETSLCFVSGSLLIPLLFPESASAVTVVMVCVVVIIDADPVLKDRLSFRRSEREGRLRLKSSEELILTLYITHTLPTMCSPHDA